MADVFFTERGRDRLESPPRRHEPAVIRPQKYPGPPRVRFPHRSPQHSVPKNALGVWDPPVERP